MEVARKLSDTIDALLEEVEPEQVLRCQLTERSQPASFRCFISALIDDAEFRQNFSKLLADTRFKSFRFETPALTSRSIDKPFEFVLINAPGLSASAVDSYTFAEHFPDNSIADNDTNAQNWVVEFKSLGGDATLIAPLPRASHETYTHLASFTRSAPARQIDVLWETVGLILERDMGDSPLWLNTEGSGVAWLHVRIDSRPKYYSYTRYKSPEKLMKSHKQSGARS